MLASLAAAMPQTPSGEPGAAVLPALTTTGVPGVVVAVDPSAEGLSAEGPRPIGVHLVVHVEEQHQAET